MAKITFVKDEDVGEDGLDAYYEIFKDEKLVEHIVIQETEKDFIVVHYHYMGGVLTNRSTLFQFNTLQGAQDCATVLLT